MKLRKRERERESRSYFETRKEPKQELKENKWIEPKYAMKSYQQNRHKEKSQAQTEQNTKVEKANIWMAGSW